MLRNHRAADDNCCRQEILNDGRWESEFRTHKDVPVFIENSVIEDGDDDISENEIDYFTRQTVGAKQTGHDDVGVDNGFRRKSFSVFFCSF